MKNEVSGVAKAEPEETEGGLVLREVYFEHPEEGLIGPFTIFVPKNE